MAKSGVMPEHNAELDVPILQNDVCTENELPSTPCEPSLKEKESVGMLNMISEQKRDREGKTLLKELQKRACASCGC